MPFGSFGFSEMLLIFGVLLLLFGAKRLPELASGMGKGIRDFKRAVNGLDEDSVQKSVAPPVAPPQVQASTIATPQVEAQVADPAKTDQA